MTIANEKKNLEMIRWTLQDLRGLRLDRTERSGPTALHRAEKPLVCPL